MPLDFPGDGFPDTGTASTLWVLGLGTAYADLTLSAPGGLAVTQPVPAAFGSASIASSELALVHGGSTAASFNASGVNPYGAPRVEFTVSRGITDTLVIRGRWRCETAGAGSFPEMGLFVCKDADAPGADRGFTSTRVNGTASYFWNNANVQTAGPTLTTAQRDTTGMWARIIIGSMGGIQAWYSVEDESDPDAVTWTEWEYGATAGAWYFTEAEGGPQQDLRFGFVVGQDGTGTASEGRLMYLDCSLTPTGA